MKKSKPTSKRQGTEVTSYIKVTRKISTVKLNLNMKNIQFHLSFFEDFVAVLHKNLTLCPFKGLPYGIPQWYYPTQ